MGHGSKSGERTTMKINPRESPESALMLQAALLDAALDSIIICDQNGELLEFNAAAEKMFGYSRAGVISRDLAELIIPERLRAAHRKGMDHFQKTGHGPVLNHRIELPALRADGTEFPVELTIVPILAGGARLFTAYVRDISERKRAEDSQHEQARLAALRADISAHLATAEPLQAVLKKCAEVLIGHLGGSFCGIWTLNEAEQVLEVQASAGASQPDDGPPHRVEVGQFKIGRIALSRHSHLTNDLPNDPFLSNPEWAIREGMVSFAGYPLIVEGRSLGVLGLFGRQPLSDAVFADLAPIADSVAQYVERKRAEEELRRSERTARFLAAASSALAELTDYESTLQKIANFAVPHFADWCAVDLLDEKGERRRLAVTHSDPGQVQSGQEFVERYPPRPDAAHGVGYVLRTGEPELMEVIPDSFLVSLAHDEKHLRIMRKIGAKSQICVPMKSVGKTLGAISFLSVESGRRYDRDDLRVAQDLADRAAVAIQNATYFLALQESDRRKDEFLATLAHELRNPLAPIRTSLEIMKRSEDDPVVMDQVRLTMDRQISQMARLVDDLLNVSRITRNKLELRKDRVELATIIHNAVETSRSLLDSMGHHLTVTLPPLPVFLNADPTRLAQVFLNLLNNAAKYTERGGQIALTCEVEGAEVVVRVTDTGIGIPAAMLPKIFDMFVQVDRSLERAQGGLGIGLTLVKRLVELHGGTVEARSEGAGKGSEFVVRLPIVTAADLVEPSEAPIVVSPVSTKHRILVVDDNQDSADSLAMLLQFEGHEVCAAYDGDEALSAAATWRPDVILLDIGLPKRNGYEVAEQIRSQPWGTDILLVAVTGWGQAQDRQRSTDAGFNHHLVKPIELDALHALLASATPQEL